ncbi:50S ribosomal protein L3 [Candidatus Woesearchaeota archaeon]|nr:50S ribosomal protein L3 [Candidatus Woesearchaeota archaeon]
MPRTRAPRAGSMQFWPRARSRYSYARVRTWASSKDAKPLGFAGYKVGMTHLLISDNKATSMTKGTDIFCPTTVLECPPVKAISLMFYKKTQFGSRLVSQLFSDSLDKSLERKITIPKKKGAHPEDFDFLRILCSTQPSLTGIGKKKPEMFELAIGGSKEQQLLYAKEKLGKEINVNESIREGSQVDIHSVTKGKGFQGPVRRFGVTLRHHKSEKSRRNPGSLGAWNAQGHIMWRTAHAGKMGNHLRTEYNKWVVKIGSNPNDINVKGGYLNYGAVKNTFVLIKGSVAGPKKMLVRITEPIRPKSEMQVPQISYTSLESKQGR